MGVESTPNKNIDSPEFNINIAFKDVNFWTIIFAGFAVYVIFILIFNFVMKEYKKDYSFKNTNLIRLFALLIKTEIINR